MATWPVIYNDVTQRLEIPQGVADYTFEHDVVFNYNVTLNGNVNGAPLSTITNKTDLIQITTGVDLDAHEAIVSQITVTQPVDLDVIEARVNALDAAVVLMGSHDASTLLFPASTVAGESWIISVAGTVDGIPFAVGDRVVALIDAAPNNAYVGNWLKLDYTDQVSSVGGKTGAVMLLEADITDLQGYLLPTDVDSLAKLNALIGDTVVTTGNPNHSHTRDQLIGLPFELTYNFVSRPASSGIAYLGGFYSAPAADANLTQAAATVNYGSANASQGAHAFMVFGAGSTDGATITVTVSGTSIADDGTRTPADSEILYTGAVAGLNLNDYLETTKRWLGQITYTLTSDGINFTCDFNYGLALADRPYNASSASLERLIINGVANATDAGFDVELLLHSSLNWTYSAAAFVPGGTTICQMTSDESTDAGIIAGEDFAYIRTFSTTLAGTEKFLLRVTTTANAAVEFMRTTVSGSITPTAP